MAVHEQSQGSTDEYYTPKYIFEALECRFDLDVASPVDRQFCHVPADKFITEDSLSKDWGESFVWMNPPFGDRSTKKKWLDKLSAHGNGIALTPDRSSAPWWQEVAPKSDAILFVAKKIKFIYSDGSTGDSPSTGTTLFAFGERGAKALLLAEKNGLGLVLYNRLKLP